MKRRRVVITGLGILSALGKNRTEFWQSVTEGRSGIGPLESVPDARVAFSKAAEIRDFDPAAFLDNREDRMLDPSVQFALITAREAVQDSGIAWNPELQKRTAVATGCALGGKLTEEGEYRKLFVEGKKRAHPFTIPRIMGNAGASRISMEFGLQGPVFTMNTACSAANHAIGQAFWIVRSGAADAALTGGHEALFCLGNLRAWDALRVVSPDTCRPFSKDRDGMILGEGSGFLVLETLESARARNAKIYAEMVGFGMTADAGHLTYPGREQPARAMQEALSDGGLRPEEVGYINAHGTGTLANDPNEVNVIRDVFGDHADRLAVSSTKSLHGHALGAAGALEAVATVLALDQGILPPTANFTEPDPECAIDVVPNEAREARVEAALSSSFAFGGLNAVLALRRFDPDRKETP